MKNIQLIDSALNCAFAIYHVEDSVFEELFPMKDQDLEFIEDVVQRCGEDRASFLMKAATSTRADKKCISGIHGTLFVGMARIKSLYPVKVEAELDKMLVEIPRHAPS